MTELYNPFPQYRADLLRSLPVTSPDLSYIALGVDSTVLLWRQNGQPDSVLKYYNRSNITPSTLTKYSEALTLASESITIPPLSTPVGDINIEFVPVDRMGTVQIGGREIAVSQSKYIPGLELHAVYYFDEVLHDPRRLEQTSFTEEGTEKALNVYRWLMSQKNVSEAKEIASNLSEWLISHVNPHKDPLIRKIQEIDEELKNFFGTHYVVCNFINTRLHTNGEGITLYITDIANSIERFINY
jgi:hypothetical protein